MEELERQAQLEKKKKLLEDQKKILEAEQKRKAQGVFGRKNKKKKKK